MSKHACDVRVISMAMYYPTLVAHIGPSQLARGKYIAMNLTIFPGFHFTDTHSPFLYTSPQP